MENNSIENKVFAIDCSDYEEEKVYQVYKKLLINNNLLDFVKKDMTIAIKANLVAASKPENAVTTHFVLLKCLCKILVDMGAKVIVGDSPGGPFNDMILKPIYNKTKTNQVLEVGAFLNKDFSTSLVDTPNLKVVKQLDCSDWLLKADAIINFAKMKSHGMMSLSSSVKNMFGSVPGTNKLEYHYRYSTVNNFSNMLIDIQEFYKCQLHLVDAIDAMEGNGPTMGSKRHVGLLMASKSCYALDLVCCKLMNLNTSSVNTIQEAINRQLSVSSFEELSMNMDITPFIVSDFKNIEHGDDVEFYKTKKNILKYYIGKLAKSLLIVKPKANNKECIGCCKCANICPAKAINMKKKRPKINRKVCIRCFCCQEFCPVGAMKTHKTWFSKLINRKKRKK